MPGCIVRISLGQGYGELYQQKKIKSCPCWIEVKLFAAQRWLERVIRFYQEKQQIETDMESCGTGRGASTTNGTLFN